MSKNFFIFTITVSILLLSCGSRELNKDLSEQKPETYPTRSILHFMHGEIYRSSGNYTYANLEYQRALEYDTSATILSAIAESYKQLGKNQQARDYFEKALRLDPEAAGARQHLADLYIKESRFEKAIPLLRQILEKEPENITLLRSLAEAYRKIEDYDASLNVLDKMIELRPDIPWSYIFAAEVMFEDDRIADASAYLEKAISLVPPNDDLYEFWIRALYEKNDREKIQKVLRSWIKTQPDRPGPYLMYADYQFQRGNIDSAGQVLSMISDRWQQDSRISYFQGIRAMTDNEKDSVMFYFKRADSFPDAGRELYHDYGMWFWEQGEFETAEYIAGRAIVRFGPEARWLHMKALIKKQQGLLEESEKLFLELLEEDPENTGAKEDLATVYLESGKGDLADSLYSDLLKENPEDPAILNNYAFTLAQLDRKLDEALSYINKALREKKNAAYCDTKAWILYRQGKFKRALKWVNNALKYSDVSSEIYLHKGNILRKLQRYEPAREAFRQALSLDPENTLVKKALEEMK